MRNSRQLLRFITIFIIGSVLASCASTRRWRGDALDLKIGQMILTGFPGTEVDTLVLQDVSMGKIGSIILFEKNIPKSTAAFTNLKRIIWTYQRSSPTPLIVAIDQEGGRVNRLKEKYGFTRSLTAQSLGKSPTLDSVRFYAEATAATLAGLGINVNFAPVVDLGLNKDNTVIYQAGRSFSASPDSVVLLATEFIKPHRRFGVATVLKHFPGHGSSLSDTHVGVADVTNTWTAAELIPYQRLIEAGMTDAVMSAHIVNKNLEPKALPGTLSSRMLDSLLRKQLRFDGVVFSDDMQMQAIASQYGLEESIRFAINAGIDILCFSNNAPAGELRKVDEVHGIIRKLVRSGDVSEERIDESYRRILKMKARFGLSPDEYLEKELKAAREEIAQLKNAAAQEDPKKDKKKKKK